MTADVSGARPRLTEQVAEEIRALLARRRISGRELARRMEASHSWVNFRLTGAQPITLDDLQRFAEVLGVEVTDLLPRQNEGRVVARAGAGNLNHRSAYLAHRPPQRTKQTNAEGLARNPCPNRRPQPGTNAPTPAGPPRQRRPALIASAG